MFRIAVIVANKSEDIEVITPVDIWRRAGFFVRIISVEKKKNLILNRGTRIVCDDVIINENLSKYNGIYLPGGEGYKNFNDVDAPKLISFLKHNAKNKKITYMAACAATQVYGCLEMLEGVKATCYPGCEASFKKSYVNKPVVADKNFITANGPSAMIEFALTVVKKCLNEKTAKEIAVHMLYKGKF